MHGTCTHNGAPSYMRFFLQKRLSANMVQYPEKAVKPIDEFCPIWSVITPEERMYLRENTRIQRYRKGAFLYREGELPRYMFCLISGRVKVFKKGVGDRCQIIRFAKPCDNFGYRSSFAQDVHLTNAMATEPAEAYLVPMSVVKQIIQSNNKLATHFICALAQNLGADENRLVSLTQKHVRGRLAESLLTLRDSYGTDLDGRTINSRLSREDLANYSNMTTSNAIRTLSTFVNEGIISVRGRYITILDEEMLHKISKMG